MSMLMPMPMPMPMLMSMPVYTEPLWPTCQRHARAHSPPVAPGIFSFCFDSAAALENQPTSSGTCYGSHWEELHWNNELMAASTSSTNMVHSALTLALLEDSGWYKV